MSVNTHDREILRSLAGQFRAVADSEQNIANKKLLTDLNSLKNERPVVLCFPEGAWPELVNDSHCQCADPLLRSWELHLRSELFMRTVVCDDAAVEPCFYIRWQFDPGNFGVDIAYDHGDNRGSYTWQPPLKNLPDDIEKLKFRRPSVNRDETQRQFELASDIFDGLLDVQISGRGFYWTCGLTSTAIALIGLEQLMLAMYDQPEGLHKLMQWLSDEMAQYIQWFEDQQLYTLNNTDGYTGSGGKAYCTELPGSDYKPGEPVKMKHLWGFAESQETVGVSPDMFAEFVLPYQMPMLEKFGLNCYGCCEPVDTRWQHIKTIPNLRRVSVSPWCNQEKIAEQMGRNYIFSRKPNPAHICAGFNIDAARADVRNTLDIAGNCPLEIIMKDTHTVENDPTRLSRWVQMVRQEIHQKS